MAIFKLGTRGSLLAVTQSTLVKNQLELHYPEHQFQLNIIKTQGDLITNKPLWQLEGKDFFTKELDEALLQREVDFVVHSCKDLSTLRPTSLTQAAITNRVFPHDVLLITKETLAKIQQKEISSIVIGTSSPRRQYLLNNKINSFIPFGEHLEIKYSNLRGNVNTRIEKLISGEYDLICLAAAGLERLASHPDSKLQLDKLLTHINLKFLPLSTFPCAPAQGALAIECLSDNNELKNMLKILNCANTTDEILEERKIFQQYGGGCHLALGVYVKKHTSQNLKITTAKGSVDKSFIDIEAIEGFSLEMNNTYDKIFKESLIFTGLTSSRHKELNLPDSFISDESKRIIPFDSKNQEDFAHSNYYLTSEHNISTFAKYIKPSQEQSSIWVAGSTLHQKLSRMGYWITGDNDSQGPSALLNTLKSSLASYIFHQKPTVQLSYKGQHNHEFATWETYEANHDIKNLTIELKKKIETCKVFFWTSSLQFNFYTKNFPQILKQDIIHFCGIGKTFDHLKKENKIKILPLINIQHFLKYTKRQKDL
jgi:hydroxymethylbilane synthase